MFGNSFLWFCSQFSTLIWRKVSLFRVIYFTAVVLIYIYQNIGFIIRNNKENEYASSCSNNLSIICKPPVSCLKIIIYQNNKRDFQWKLPQYEIQLTSILIASNLGQMISHLEKTRNR